MEITLLLVLVYCLTDIVGRSILRYYHDYGYLRSTNTIHGEYGYERRVGNLEGKH